MVIPFKGNPKYRTKKKLHSNKAMRLKRGIYVPDSNRDIHQEEALAFQDEHLYEKQKVKMVIPFKGHPKYRIKKKLHSNKGMRLKRGIYIPDSNRDSHPKEPKAFQDEYQKNRKVCDKKGEHLKCNPKYRTKKSLTPIKE